MLGENAEFLAGPAGQALGLAGDAVRQREDRDAVQTDRARGGRGGGGAADVGMTVSMQLVKISANHNL